MPKPTESAITGIRGLRTFRAAFAVLVSMAAVPALSGQTASVILPNSFEAGGFVGASYGIDKFRVMGGGNLTYAVNRFLLPYVEYSYFPGIGREETGTFADTGRPYTINYSIPLSDFHGGVHLRIPIREKPVVPYFVFGVGAVTNQDRTVDATFTDVSGVRTQPYAVRGRTDFAVNTDGGLRYYINQRFGVRAEAKAYRPSGEFSKVFGKVEFGFFFQFR